MSYDALIAGWEDQTRTKILDEIERDEMGEFIDGSTAIGLVDENAEASHVLNLLGSGWVYDSTGDIFVRGET